MSWFKEHGWKYDNKDHCWKKEIEEKKEEEGFSIVIMDEVSDERLNYLIWKYEEKGMFPEIEEKAFEMVKLNE